MNWINSLNDTYSTSSLFKENLNISKSIKETKFRVKIYKNNNNKKNFRLA